MGWGIRFQDSFMWPDALDPKSGANVKANKKGELNDVFHDLAALQAEHKRFSNTIRLAPQKAGRGADTEKWVQDATAFASSADVKKLVGSLKIVGKRAATAAAKPKISSDAKKTLQAIAKSANDHAAAIEPAKLAREIGQIRAELVKAGHEASLKMAGMTLGAFKDCAKKGHPGIAEAKRMLTQWAANPAADDATEAQKIGTELYNDCRDMTQPLTNMLKVQQAGADLTQFGFQQRDIETLPGLGKTLVPLANASKPISTGKNRAEMQKLVHLADVNAKLFDTIASHLR
jgi:hypothetical protein